jgi:hypothetical protein
MPPKADDYRRALRARFDRATARGQTSETVVSGDLYAEAGAKPSDRQMPNCCRVMWQEFHKGRASLVSVPTSYQWSSVTYRYDLPR